MNKVIFATLTCSLLILGGCGPEKASNKDSSSVSSTLNQVDVNFSTNPKKPKAGEVLTLSLQVTENGQVCKDAEIKFTVRHKEQPKVVLSAKLDSNGKYSAELKDVKAGEYTVVSCVTTSKAHKMPEHKFQVALQ